MATGGRERYAIHNNNNGVIVHPFTRLSVPIDRYVSVGGRGSNTMDRSRSICSGLCEQQRYTAIRLSSLR